jgi:hypothetical protein
MGKVLGMTVPASRALREEYVDVPENPVKTLKKALRESGVWVGAQVMGVVAAHLNPEKTIIFWNKSSDGSLVLAQIHNDTESLQEDRVVHIAYSNNHFEPVVGLNFGSHVFPVVAWARRHQLRIRPTKNPEGALLRARRTRKIVE